MRNSQLGRVIAGLSLVTLLILAILAMICLTITSHDDVIVSSANASSCNCAGQDCEPIEIGGWPPADGYVGHGVYDSTNDPEQWKADLAFNCFGASDVDTVMICFYPDWDWAQDGQPCIVDISGSVTPNEPGEYSITVTADDDPDSRWTCPHENSISYYDDPSVSEDFTYIIWGTTTNEPDIVPPAKTPAPTPSGGDEDEQEVTDDDLPSQDGTCQGSGGGGASGGSMGGGGVNLGGTMGSVPSMSGYPVSYIKREKLEQVVDLSIPVKHGLSLDVCRMYTSRGFKSLRNFCGEVSLGYSNVTNWHLWRYESKIDKVSWRERQFVALGSGGPVSLVHKGLKVGTLYYRAADNNIYSCGAQAGCDIYEFTGYDPASPPKVEYEEHVLEFVDEDGSINYYGYVPNSVQQVSANGELQSLRIPTESHANAFWVSEFTPIGSTFTPRTQVSASHPFMRRTANTMRRTTQDMTLYVIHTSTNKVDQLYAPQPLLGGACGAKVYHETTAPEQGERRAAYGSWPYVTYFEPWSILNGKPVVKALASIYSGLEFNDDGGEAWNGKTNEPNMTAMGVAGYVVRYSDGRQMNYDADGNLIYYDVNWHNNTQYGTTGHIDDYLHVVWANRQSPVRNNATFKQVAEVQAPPSDGRKLIFNQLDNNTASCMKSVSLQVGSTTYQNLVNYAYVASGKAAGKLMRVTDQSNHGIQYAYGNLTVNSNSSVSIVDPTSKDPKLCLKSEYTNGAAVDQVAIQYDYTQPVPLVTAEWLRDSELNWRKAFTLSKDANGNSVWTYQGGIKWDSTGRYNNYDTQITYTRTDTGNLESATISGNNTSHIPVTKMEYFTGTMIPKKKLIRVSENPVTWNVLEEYIYNAQYPDRCTGIARPVIIKKYPSSDPESALITTITYDATFKDQPSVVIGPDGRKETFTYNSEGKILTHATSQRDWSDMANETYDAVSTTQYTYLTTADNLGFLASVTTTPVVGPAQTVEYTYYTTTGSGAIAGMVHTVEVNNEHTTTYTYNNFGQVVSVSSDGQTTNYTYSTNYYPPRLVSVTDPTNQTTTYQYDSAGRVEFVTNPAGQQTQNAYDNQGRLESITTPDTGSYAMTHYTYDCFGHMLTLTDPEMTVTNYDYDEYDRVTSEKLGDVSNPTYTISYDYVGDSGASCGTCGGGSNSTIAARTIKDGTHEETITYNYDLMGRLLGMENSLDNNEILYTYAGTMLTEIDHGNTLWGSHKLKYTYDKHHRLAREIYPNGRSIDFTYDAAGRLASVKDPFGYVNSVAYDAEGRLGTISHSTLGTATFTYDTNDRLSRLMLGNGAYTDYGRDTYGRLTSFDIKQSDNTRIMKHEWQYDNLGRKSAAAGITVTGPNLPSPISFSYDAASRVTHEALNNTWSVDYGYDLAGNRTSVNDGTISRTMGYGVGNRETSVSNNITPLGYDYKGNVVSRMTLDGTKTFQYGWDAYDRLISAVQGTTNVYYDYDTMGRLLRRTKPTGTTAETTINYWLGLNKIAEERVVDGADKQLWRADSEQGTNPAANGWGIYAPRGVETMQYATDSERGKALHCSTSDGGISTFISGDCSGCNFNPNAGLWDVPNRRQLGFWFRNVNGNVASINVYCRVTSGASTIQLNTGTGTDFVAGWGGYIFYIGEENPGINDGNWHYIKVDLGALHAHFSGVQDAVTRVDGILFYARNIWIDDITLFSKTYPLEVFRPDSEEESMPYLNGWCTLTGSCGYETDPVRGKVAHLQASYGAIIIGDDWNESLNYYDAKFNDSARKHLGLWIKNADASHTPFQIQVYAATAHYPTIMLNLVADNGTDGSYTKYLGSTLNDGAWHYVELDLGAFVASQESGDSLTTIHGLSFTCYANDLYVDDIILSGGELERSYGFQSLGTQTGSNGARDVNTQTQVVSAWGKYYSQASDLGAIAAFTDGTGSEFGVSMFDFMGMHSHLVGARPDLAGISNKFLDYESHLYLFGARWYDAERGVFYSRSIYWPKAEETYVSNHNDPINNIDPDGNLCREVDTDALKPDSYQYWNGRGEVHWGTYTPYEKCLLHGYKWTNFAEAHGWSWSECVDKLTKDPSMQSIGSKRAKDKLFGWSVAFGISGGALVSMGCVEAGIIGSGLKELAITGGASAVVTGGIPYIFDRTYEVSESMAYNETLYASRKKCANDGCFSCK